MKKKLSVLLQVLASLFIFQGQGYACSCSPFSEYFCAAANQSQHIVLAEIIDSTSYDKRKIKIIENINKEFADSVVLLIGQNGWNCGQTLYDFLLKDTFVLALYPDIDSGYILSHCGRHYLRYDNGFLNGPVSPDFNTGIGYTDFLEDINECMLLVSTEEIAVRNSQLAISPNPFEDRLYIKSEKNEIRKIEIFNLQGQRILAREGDDRLEINLEMYALKPGVYLLCIHQDNGIISRKISKM